jgi:hypothetical protein
MRMPIKKLNWLIRAYRPTHVRPTYIRGARAVTGWIASFDLNKRRATLLKGAGVLNLIVSLP